MISLFSNPFLVTEDGEIVMGEIPQELIMPELCKLYSLCYISLVPDLMPLSSSQTQNLNQSPKENGKWTSQTKKDYSCSIYILTQNKAAFVVFRLLFQFYASLHIGSLDRSSAVTVCHAWHQLDFVVGNPLEFSCVFYNLSLHDLVKSLCFSCVN